MVKNLNPARIQIMLEFGKEVQNGKRNPNTGKAMKSYTTKFTKWAGQYTLTQSQAITLAGQSIRDAIVFFIRHDLKVTSDYLIKWGDQIYKIDSIAYDDGLPPDGFDLITCHMEVSHD